MLEYYTEERMLAIKESQDYKDLLLVAWDIDDIVCCLTKNPA